MSDNAMRRSYLLERVELSRREWLLTALFAGVAAPVRAETCRPTSRAIQGPYWREGAPSLTELARGITGTKIRVHGSVIDARSCKPVAGAAIEVWQADATGRYDIDYGPDRTFLRSSIVTDAQGRYAFSSIRPAPYAVGAGTRPAHIHFMVTAGRRKLVTQMYFAGDPHLDSDPLRAVHGDLVVTPEGSNGECRFDLVMT